MLPFLAAIGVAILAREVYEYVKTAPERKQATADREYAEKRARQIRAAHVSYSTVSAYSYGAKVKEAQQKTEVQLVKVITDLDSQHSEAVENVETDIVTLNTMWNLNKVKETYHKYISVVNLLAENIKWSMIVFPEGKFSKYNEKKDLSVPKRKKLIKKISAEIKRLSAEIETLQASI